MAQVVDVVGGYSIGVGCGVNMAHKNALFSSNILRVSLTGKKLIYLHSKIMVKAGQTNGGLNRDLNECINGGLNNVLNEVYTANNI